MSKAVQKFVAALLATSLSIAVPAQGIAAKDALAAGSVSASERADALVKQMSLEEKLRYVHGLFPEWTKSKSADMLPSAGYVPGVPALRIPTLRQTDAGLGVANQVEQRKGDTATALPSSLATAAGFDPALAYAGGAMIGSEARAKTFNVLLAGGVNLTRDAWNGRNFEYLGEDPLLSGKMAAATIRGVQSNHIVSTVKHFALNAQEDGRLFLNAQIDEEALRESDLLAFDIAISDGRPGAVMCAYNLINSDWACENRFLLTQILRDEWHYPGWVMSDWGAVHSTDKAVLAGLDQESGQELDRHIYFGAPLAASVATGRVPEARIDEMVHRILTGVIESGLYDAPSPVREQPIDLATHADVAQQIAEAGIVLLRNEGGVLPLARTAKRIVVIGGHADVGVLSGGGSSQVRSIGGVPVEITLTAGAASSFARITYHRSSPLDAIRAMAPQADVRYLDGEDAAAAAAAAKSADIAIVFATQWRSEAQDIPNLSLPDGQDALIDAVTAANGKTVVVVESGGAVLMPWLDRTAAVLEAWYPGQRGGEAIARVLFGEVDAGGRLPLTFPESEAQMPRPHAVRPQSGKLVDAMSNPGIRPMVDVPPFAVPYPEGANVGYRWFAANAQKPLFPFGFGLSYGTVAFDKPVFTGGARPHVTVRIRNTGARPSVAVPQVYARPVPGAPPKLAGWQRVTLASHATQTVTIAIDLRVLAQWRQDGWLLEGGDVPMTLATDAAHAIAQGRIRIAARQIGRGSLSPLAR